MSDRVHIAEDNDAVYVDVRSCDAVTDDPPYVPDEPIYATSFQEITGAWYWVILLGCGILLACAGSVAIGVLG